MKVSTLLKIVLAFVVFTVVYAYKTFSPATDIIENARKREVEAVYKTLHENRNFEDDPVSTSR